MPQFCQLWLTCKDSDEADRIAALLLDKKLVACTKRAAVLSEYWWKGEVERGKEVLLVMESREDLFGSVEEEVAKLHSYDTFVLQAIPMNRVSKKAENWLEENLKSRVEEQ